MKTVYDNDFEKLKDALWKGLLMKIIIYGYGKTGKSYEKYIRENKLAEIVAITDKKYDLNRNQNSLFVSIDECKNFEYDYIIITPIDYEDEIRAELLLKGFSNNKIKNIFSYDIAADSIFQKNRYCNLCNKSVIDFLNVGVEASIFTQRKIIGGGIRKGRCPNCGASDRERFVYFVLKSYCNLFTDQMTGKKILHFAPERRLVEKIKNTNNEYITADIEEGRADVVADIRKLKFKNEEFDFVICNHVLEHIDREKDALNELWRVLKKGGVLICSVPICWEENTFEDQRVVSEDDRIKYYGQKDHVRLYGRDFGERLIAVGFDVTCYKTDEIFELEQIEKNGFIYGDSCFIARKK